MVFRYAQTFEESDYELYGVQWTRINLFCYEQVTSHNKEIIASAIHEMSQLGETVEWTKEYFLDLERTRVLEIDLSNE